MGKNKTSSTKRRWLIAAGIILLIIMILAGWCAYKALSGYHGDEVRIYIPSGATAEQVGDTLRTRLGDSFGCKVYDIWKMQGGRPETARGSYVVKPGTRAAALSRRLFYGRQTPMKFTFNNIRTMSALAERAAAKLEFSASDFLAACDSVLPASGYSPQAYPAAFVPDTYELYWTTSPAETVKKLVGARDRFWTDSRRKQASRLGLTPVEAATVASIVEEETAKADERPAVARLYINRLDKKMRLQADPTVKFAVGDFSLRRITGRHLKTLSPYNTYINAGLPPGPIRIASQAAIDAVLNAPEHDYLYMCAKEDFSGYHNFAADYAAHMANARRYQAALDRRGIK